MADTALMKRTRSVRLPTHVTLECVEQGDPNGRPVVFLHGLSDSWHSFELVLPLLPDSVRAIVPSQRGHGASSRPDAGYRPRDFAADVAALMDAADVEAAIVVGHSSGATTAQRFAVDHPGRTLGLCLVGAFFDLSQAPVAQQLSEEVSRLQDPVEPGFVRDFQKSTLARPVPEQFFDTIIHESLKLPARVWMEAVAGSLQADVTGALSRITAPTLLVWGDRDELTPRSDQTALAAAIPDARLLVYEGAGHGVHWEQPKRFASDLASFVAQVARP